MRLVASRTYVSARLHRDRMAFANLTSPELFDEYTRRQYVAKAPQRNPFGVEEAPASFADFDVFAKVGALPARVLTTS